MRSASCFPDYLHVLLEALRSFVRRNMFFFFVTQWALVFRAHLTTGILFYFPYGIIAGAPPGSSGSMRPVAVHGARSALAHVSQEKNILDFASASRLDESSDCYVRLELRRTLDIPSQNGAVTPCIERRPASRIVIILSRWFASIWTILGTPINFDRGTEYVEVTS